MLDLCAAPGGKTTHLAALMEGRGEVVAVERHAGRAAALARTVARMGADRASASARRTPPSRDEPDAYDRVLVDPPCSDLGTLASRPDARWRKAADAPAPAGARAGRDPARGRRALRPGGTLVYSTCTISPTENEQVGARRSSRAQPGFAADDLRAVAPLWEHPACPARS